MEKPVSLEVSMNFVITSYSIHYTKLYDVGGSSTVLSPADVGEIDVFYNETGYHKIKVISEQGVSRTLTVKIN